MGVVAGETENAWPCYVKAATGYVQIEEDFEEIILDGLKSGQLNLSDEQVGKLRQWYDENRLSWASLKEATSIDYCNAMYDNISIIDSNDKNDFSNPSDSGYCRIRNLYRNVNACRILGVIDLDWFDLFKMQLASSKHFAGGKTFIDQCVGYGMLWRSIKFLADKDNYELGDLEKSRRLLKEYFPAGVPVLNIEGDILVECSSYDSMINFMKIPVQSPFNPAFMMVGSITGTEAYLRKNYATMLEQARNGVEVEEEEFSVMSFPILRRMFFNIFGEDVARNYKYFQKTGANLLAGYFLLDLEEYRLVKGEYPADVLELGRAGFDSQLPDDIDSGGKVIYLNDGDRAVLYAVGKNGTDDSGYKDGKEAETKRDDVVYWERDLKEEKLQRAP